MIQNDSISIRLAVELDVHDIAEVAYRNSRNPWTEAGLLEELKYDFSLLIAAELNYSNKSSIIGFANLHITEPEAHLNEIAIEKQYRRMNIGSRLLYFCINESKVRGCEYITLEVRESNEEAIRFYKKNGFHILGKRKKIYTDPNDDAIIMRLEI